MKPETVNKFIALEKQLARERGKFVLFALFEREESKNRWDVVASAPWLSDHRRWNDLTYQVSSRLDSSELNRLSRVVVLDPSDEVVQSMNRNFRVEHKNVEIRDFEVYGILIYHAHIFTSNRLAAPPSVPHRQTYHVVPNPDFGWAVKKGGADRATKQFETKQDAIDYAREVSRNQSRNLIIHGKDGRIQRSETP
jgi:hypothetical protein